MAASFFDSNIDYPPLDTNGNNLKYSSSINDEKTMINHRSTPTTSISTTTTIMMNGGSSTAPISNVDHPISNGLNFSGSNSISHHHQIFNSNHHHLKLDNDPFHSLSSTMDQKFSQISLNSDNCDLNGNRRSPTSNPISSSSSSAFFTVQKTNVEDNHHFFFDSTLDNNNPNHIHQKSNNNGWNIEFIRQSLRSKLATTKRLQQEIQNNYDDSYSNYRSFIIQCRSQLDAIMQNIDGELNQYFKTRMMELNIQKTKIEDIVHKLDEQSNLFNIQDANTNKLSDINCEDIFDSDFLQNVQNILESSIDSSLIDSIRIPNIDVQTIDRFIRALIFPMNRQQQHQQQQPILFNNTDSFLSTIDSHFDAFQSQPLSTQDDNFAKFSDHQHSSQQQSVMLAPWSSQQPTNNNLHTQQHNSTKNTSLVPSVHQSTSHFQHLIQPSFDFQQQQRTQINPSSSFMDTKNQFFLGNINDEFPALTSYINDHHHQQQQTFNGSIHPSQTHQSINDLNILNQKQAITKSLQPRIRRERISYYLKFGEQGAQDGQFAEPSGVAVNLANDEIYIADANNHRVQVFDKWGKFKFHFGEGKLKFPNRVALSRNTGEIVVSERPPVHQIQVYSKNGIFQCKFGAKHLRHPRGLAVDHQNRVVVVECKVMRVFAFSLQGVLLHSFDCSERIQFPNAVAVSRSDEIFISDNRNHCVKVFNFNGDFLRQIGGQGITNYPIGVCLNEAFDQLLVVDNYNNLNVTLFRLDGHLIGAYESSGKHQQCLDVALFGDHSIVVTSKDLQVYFYRLKEYIQQQQSNINQKRSTSVNNNNLQGSFVVSGTGTHNRISGPNLPPPSSSTSSSATSGTHIKNGGNNLNNNVQRTHPHHHHHHH